MCGPSWVAYSWRSSFIETQAFVENKVHFKSGAIFAADRAVSLECWNKLTVKPRQVASHADVLRGSSRVPAPRTRDEPLRTSA